MFLIKESLSDRSARHVDEIVDIAMACENGVAVVAVAGELDVSNSGWLYECLHDAIDAGMSRVVVDVELLTFMDSAGLAVIMGAYRRLKESGGLLTVLAPTPMVIRLFHVFDDVPHLMIQGPKARLSRP